ncbi:tetratricopeptide repeat protein [Arthrobacter sp. Z4-13]
MSNVAGSTIHVTLKGEERSWHVALEPATVSVGPQVTSPARLVRARSGVLPFVDRAGHFETLSEWIGTPDPFAVFLVGGPGGTGKTRLGVELCEETAEKAGWLSGMLPLRLTDPVALRDLYDTPNPRLVVIDYAETRVEQLEDVLPKLQRTATLQYPVRVLLLVRKAPQGSNDWTEALRGGSDWLETVLDKATVRILDETPLTVSDRSALFAAATSAFAQRDKPAISPSHISAPDLTGNTFTKPLLVVIAAYLAVHRSEVTPSPFPRPPSTPPDLLERLLKHEGQYWSSAKGPHINDEALQRRVIALATLAGAGAGAGAGAKAKAEAEAEAEAAVMLGQLPDFQGESAERRHSVARWVHDLYPGPNWWNPLEPDLLGEYLVSSSLAGLPQVLAGVLDREHPESIIQPLDTYARIAANDDEFADAARPILSAELERLCRIAVAEATSATNLSTISGPTVAGSLERAVSVIAVDSDVLPGAIDTIPSQPNVLLDGLALVLSQQLEKKARTSANGDSTTIPFLAWALLELSLRLSARGYWQEAIKATEEALSIYKKLAVADPLAYKGKLALALDNFAVQLAMVRHLDKASEAAQQTVKMHRELEESIVTQRPNLARALNNLAIHLSNDGRIVEALAAAEEAAEIYGKLVAEENSSLYRTGLGQSLHTLSLRLSRAGQQNEALAAAQRAVGIRRALVADDAATHAPDLAASLNNLSNRLAEVGRRKEALEASEESVALYEQLVAVHPEVHQGNLSIALAALRERAWENYS